MSANDPEQLDSARIDPAPIDAVLQAAVERGDVPSVAASEQTEKDFVFHGPIVRRMSAEQFRDALTTVTGSMVTRMASPTAGHGPAGSFDVNVRVTDPAVISSALGV